MTRTNGRRRVARLGAVGAAGLLALAAIAACTGGSSSSSSGAAAQQSGPASASTSTLTQFPRAETLYTSGSAYVAPTNWNPLNIGNMATGTQGLIYEPLFLYDPVKNQYDPWLALSTSGWKGTNYVINVRPGVMWSDGQPMTGADVAYSINLAQTNPSDPFASNVASVASATASGNTVTVTFKGNPGYTEWQDYLWKAPVLPQHVWSKLSASAQITGANNHPVGTGPMTLLTYNATEVAYQTKPSWWATSALGLSFKFKYLVDVVNGSNNVELGALTAGQVDWSNNFLPGINQLMSGIGGYGFKTFYPKTPYMLSANTVWLEPNTAKAPMNNVNFRKALAYGINPAQIVTSVYTGITAAANPTGLLPTLSGSYNQSAISQFGYSYNPTLAKQYLAKSGYSGQTVTIEVPDGWTDWQAGIQVISQELNAIGIKVQPIYPQDPARNADLTNGTYDLALDNNASLDSSPWSYFQRVYDLPIAKQQTAQLNWERFSSPKDWTLVQQAGTTPPTDTAQLTSIYNQLESDFLQQLPVIPVWYNGAWFQGSTKYWTNYAASGTSNEATPVMWYGYLGAMTTVYALADLKPTPPPSS